MGGLDLEGIRERVEKTKSLEGVMWPASLPYTETAEYASWHRKDVSALLDALEEAQERERRMKVFMETLPTSQTFTTRNILELYEAWESVGVIDSVIAHNAEKGEA